MEKLDVPQVLEIRPSMTIWGALQGLTQQTPRSTCRLSIAHVRVPSFFLGGKSSMMFQTKHQPNVSKFKDYTVLATVSYVRSSVILSHIVSYCILHHILHCNCHIYIKSSYIILRYLIQMYSIVGGFNPSEKY